MSVGVLSTPRVELPKMGRFAIRRSLGGGARGKVFQAIDPVSGQHVAIGWLNTMQSDRCGSVTDSWLSEVRRIAGLRHPNIVALQESGVYKESPFLVSDFVQGTTLRDRRLQVGPLPVQVALRLFSAILAGVAYAHAQNIHHLTLSPENVMIDAAGVPRVMDFGIARLTGRERFACGGRSMSPRRYASPEQFTEGPVTARADVYALGMMLLEMMGGRPSGYTEIAQAPHGGAPVQEDMDRIGLAPMLRALIGCALSVDANSRYGDAAAMKLAVDELIVPDDPATERGAIGLLLQRMEQKPSFPALSKNLMEINRLADESSNANIAKLANIVLCDYAITNKLLQLANSSFYGGAHQGIKTVSRAIQVLGMGVIRTTCNGLVYFNALKGDSPQLKDALISSFVGALIGRHFAIRLKRKDLAEESFISGMFYRLGRSLTLYYFPEEFCEITRLAAQFGLGEEAAALRVLGIGYGELGEAVAARWKFPDTIRQSIRYLAPGVLPKPAKFVELQQQIAAFSNELCELAASAPAEEGVERLTAFSTRFGGIISIEPLALVELLDAALQRLKEFSPVLGLELRGSQFVSCAGEFLTAMQLQMTPELEQASAAPIS